MRSGLAVGDSSEISITVDESMRASLLGLPVHPLYGTASMIAHMEWAARQHILPYLEPGEEGVGYHVDVKHLAPAPIGAKIKIHSTVSELAPRRVTSQVQAWYGKTLIGAGQLVQALVQLEKFYPTQDPANNAAIPDTLPEPGGFNETPDNPPPAVLVSSNGKERLQLEILRWETNLFACTRYDEWLICRIHLKDASREISYEGAFLLRYELEEWLSAVQAMGQNQRSGYHSEFLEPIFNIQIAEGEVGEWACTFLLHPPEQSASRVNFIVTPTALQQFGQALADQLEGFPSQL